MAQDSDRLCLLASVGEHPKHSCSRLCSHVGVSVPLSQLLHLRGKVTLVALIPHLHSPTPGHKEFVDSTFLSVRSQSASSVPELFIPCSSTGSLSPVPHLHFSEKAEWSAVPCLPFPFIQNKN